MDRSRFRSQLDRTAQQALRALVAIMGSGLVGIEMFMTAQPSVVLSKITERAVVGHPAVGQHDRTIDEATEWADLMEHN